MPMNACVCIASCVLATDVYKRNVWSKLHNLQEVIVHGNMNVMKKKLIQMLSSYNLLATWQIYQMKLKIIDWLKFHECMDQDSR